MTCLRCGGTCKLRSGADCPACTHNLTWRSPFRGNAGLHIVRCSCGWSHSETSRQNALGRASKMRGAVNAHLKSIEEKSQ